MFDIGFPELLVIAIVALLVIGPERLPEALRTLGLWLGRLRRAFTNVKAEIEKEIGMDEIRRQLHNEAVMEEMRRIERDVRSSADRAKGGDTSGTAPAGDRAADDPPASTRDQHAGDTVSDSQPPAPDPQQVATPAEPDTGAPAEPLEPRRDQTADPDG